MKRRATGNVAIALALSLAPFASFAQQAGKPARIGMLLGSSERVHGMHVERLRQGLKEEGYVDGNDIVLEYRFGDGDPDVVRKHALALVRRRVDVIVTVGLPPTRAAAKATSTIPIVVAYASSLLESGLVANMPRPGGNITGITVLTQELAAKRLEIMTETVPRASRVGVLFGPTPLALAAVAQTRSAAKKLGVALQELPVDGPGDFTNAFSVAARQQIRGLILVTGGVVSAHRRRIFAFARQRKIPTICWRPAMVQDGCLMSYGADRGRMVRQAAGYVAKILRGAKPGDLPIQRSNLVEFVINGRIAKELGIAFPKPLLMRATRIIE